MGRARTYPPPKSHPAVPCTHLAQAFLAVPTARQESESQNALEGGEEDGLKRAGCGWLCFNNVLDEARDCFEEVVIENWLLMILTNFLHNQSQFGETKLWESSCE